MKFIDKIIPFTLFAQFQMENASDLEVRLTLYLLAYILNSPKHWNFMLKDDLVHGREFFDEAGKRTLVTQGSGIPRHQINKAIDEVNKRKLILINKRDNNTMIIKLNLKHIENESKKCVETFFTN